jgi:hypothetical protein
MSARPSGFPGSNNSSAIPAARLLGVTTPGPFALLGISTEDLTQERILRGLELRLSQLAAHPHGYTPIADELRLALHAAAAQLLDEGVRRHLVSVWREPAAAPLVEGLDDAGPGPALGGVFRASSPGVISQSENQLEGRFASQAARRPAPTSFDAQAAAFESSPLDPRTELALERDITMAVALSGGWNDHTLRHLAMLAHARGVASHDLVVLLGRFMRRPAPTARGDTTHQAPRDSASHATHLSAAPRPGRFLDEPSPLDEEIDPGKRFFKAALIIGGVAIVSLTAMFILIAVVILPKPAAPLPSPPSASNTAGTIDPKLRTAPRDAAFTTPDRSSTTPVPDGSSTARIPADVLLRDAQRTVDEFASHEPDTLARFAQIASAAGAQWTSWEADFRIAMLGTHVDLALRAASTREQDLLEAIAPGLTPLSRSGPLSPEEIERGVWSAGVLSRLLSESELSVTRSRAIKALLARTLQSDAPSRARVPATVTIPVNCCKPVSGGLHSNAILPAISPRW